MPNLTEQVVADPSELSACCEHIAACDRFGFDTEFVGEDTYHPELCLVQVATPKRRYLIDPLSAGPLAAFWKLVVDPSRVVVVHAGREEIRLCHLWSGSTPGNLFDVQIAAGLLGLGYPLGHGPLIQQVLGTRLSKGETLTDWRRRPLTKEQIRYAFDDVRFLLPLWDKMYARLEKLGRTSWATEEFEALKRRAVVENPAVERWRKLRGIGSLDRKRLAVVRELFAWREEQAARSNRPPRTVLRDDLIVEIARRNPRQERDLLALRGLGRSDGEAIFEAVKRAQALPADEYPDLIERENDPPQVGLVASVLGAVLGDFCAREELTPGLVATGQDLKWLVRARFQNDPLPPESHLTHGWRREHVLPVLQGVLEGKTAIRVGDLSSPAPLGLVSTGAGEDDKVTR